MNSLRYKSRSENSNTINKDWYIVDAENETLGRMASKIAYVLRGKNKPGFTPHVDCGDNVIVINAEKIKLSGKKMTDKKYVRHTGYPGGQRFTTPKELLEKKPESVVEKAVYGMLPRTKLGNAIRRNLFVYVGGDHPHAAQKPNKLEL
ncbi:MAG: 50S ribosomal protein L13 [Bacteroidia bacterium]|nr:50S ribosomal protein L13 [Bacteroidia bacterium]